MISQRWRICRKGNVIWFGFHLWFWCSKSRRFPWSFSYSIRVLNCFWRSNYYLFRRLLITITIVVVLQTSRAFRRSSITARCARLCRISAYTTWTRQDKKKERHRCRTSELTMFCTDYPNTLWITLCIVERRVILDCCGCKYYTFFVLNVVVVRTFFNYSATVMSGN